LRFISDSELNSNVGVHADSVRLAASPIARST